MLSDAPELMETFLANEQDATCKRNAFVLLCNSATDKAIEYLLSVYDTIGNMDELMQLAVIELIRKECRPDSPNRTKYIRAISELLTASSHAVKYEAAITLTTLTQNPPAIKATASALIDLVARESDNNVKLIVLARLDGLRSRHEHVIDPLVMDLLRVLGSPDMDVRRRALTIALEMVSSRNIEEVVLFLKKELMKTVDANGGYDKNLEYRQLLIQSIHTCAIKFSEVASNVVHVLMEFLGDSSNPSAVDVISFVREVVEKFPDLRSSIVDKLLRTFGDIKSGKVFRGSLWIVGEYCETLEDVKEAMQQIRRVIGEVPILAAEERLLQRAENGGEEEAERKMKDEVAAAGKPANRVRADGTYATETAFSSEASASARLDAVKNASKPPLRSLILLGDFYTATVLAATLTKLVLRYSELSDDTQSKNALRAEAMLIMTSVVRAGQSKFAQAPIDEDSVERIMTCVQTLATVKTDKDEEAIDVFITDTKQAYAKMVQAEEKKAAETAAREVALKVQPDDVVAFRQLSKKSATATLVENNAEDYEVEVTKATGSAKGSKDDFYNRLKRVVQLSGFSDPVYAEAFVNVNQFDILLDVLVVNQSAETMQNLTIEFATLGDLRVLDKSGSHTLAPYSYQSLKTTIKVSSTETGVIFGNITYEGAAGTGTASSGDAKCVVLNDIHVDIMDYINPASCTEGQFRSMWTEFEWENKVSVNTNIKGLRTYLDHILKSTNMRCLTADASLAGECGFLSANLYARSVFGEDALANLSIEELADGAIQGHVRIRSKTQGIALSLGDRITVSQRVAKD
jgi:coatomer subunit beta